MEGNYPVITLCGSTRFKDEFLEAQKRLTLAGNIVISVGLFGHSGDDEVWTEGTKEMLDDMFVSFLYFSFFAKAYICYIFTGKKKNIQLKYFYR